MAGTITVTGKGTVNSKADTIKIAFSLSALNLSYDDALKASAESLNELSECLKKEKFKQQDIKTGAFNVNKSYKSERDDTGNYIEVFEGYLVTHNLNISFEYDTKRLADIINAISNCKAEPKFNIEFSSENVEGIKEALLKAAYEDACKSAETLAEAAGLSLIQIKNIEYVSNTPRFTSYTHYNEDAVLFSKNRAAAIEITPEDIISEETVNITWETL